MAKLSKEEKQKLLGPYKSHEELYFSWWLDELVDAGIVISYVYEKKTFTLCNSITALSTQLVERKVKVKKTKNVRASEKGTKKLKTTVVEEVKYCFTKNKLHTPLYKNVKYNFHQDSDKLLSLEDIFNNSDIDSLKKLGVIYNDVSSANYPKNDSRFVFKTKESSFLKPLTYTPDFIINWNPEHFLFRKKYNKYFKLQESSSSVYLNADNGRKKTTNGHNNYYTNVFGIAVKTCVTHENLDDEELIKNSCRVSDRVIISGDIYKGRITNSNLEMYNHLRKDPAIETISNNKFYERLKYTYENFTNGEYGYSIIDIKGSFNGANNVSAATFPIKQKLLLSVHNEYAEKILPLGKNELFASTFYPKRYLLNDSGTAPRRTKVKNTLVDLQDVPGVLTLEQFIEKKKQ